MSRAFVAASSQYLANLSASPVGGLGYTFSAWFKAATTHSGALVSLAGGTADNRHMLYVKADGKVSAFSGAGATVYENPTAGTYSTGVWTHACGVYIAGGRSSFINGAGGYVANTTNPGTMDRIHVGAYYTAGARVAGFYFNGELADVAIWDTAIDLQDIESLASGASPLLIQPNNLAAYYPLLARGTNEEQWAGSVALTNSGTTAGLSRPRVFWPGYGIGTIAATGSSDTIGISTPVDGRIHQRSGTTGTITVTGTYTGTPTTIEARLVQDGTSTPLGAFDWATKVASPAGGTYSFSFASVPQGGWYNVQVRFSNNTSINATGGKVGVGVHVALVGQSNAYLFFRSRTTATTPNSLVRVYGNIGGWAPPDNSTMAGAIGLGNALATILSLPVAVLDYAYNASVLYTQWLPVSGTVNRIFTDGVGGLDDKLEAAVWIQGEGDAAAGRSQAQYYADLGTLFADWRGTSFSQATLPIVVVTLARRLVAGYTDAQGQAITDAEIQKCGDAYHYRVDRKDLTMDADGIHHDPAGFEVLGARCARAVAFAGGAVATYRGPRINQVVKVDATNFDVWLTHDMGSDIAPSSGITGFRVLDGGTPVTISSAVRQTASKIRITLAGAPSALPVVQYLYGIAPTITSVAHDTGSLTLPIEGTSGAGITAILGSSATATVTLVNESGTAQASLSSLKWAWFDSVTPDLFVAPTDKGSTEVTNGSGVLTVDIPNSTKTTGQVGWLIVTNSDGTTTQSPAHRAFSGPVAVD